MPKTYYGKKFKNIRFMIVGIPVRSAINLELLHPENLLHVHLYYVMKCSCWEYVIEFKNT
jgi:hypothetical protein